MRRPLFTTASLLIAVAGAPDFRAHAQSSDLAAEGKRWWAHIEFLADDKLEGRNVGTPGFEKAVEYVEGQFKEIGLKPAGTSGYRQPVKFERAAGRRSTRLTLVRDGKEEPLAARAGRDAQRARRARRLGRGADGVRRLRHVDPRSGLGRSRRASI